MTIGRRMMIAAVLALGGCSFGKDVPVAEKAVDAFHAQLDAGQFDAIYTAASADLKARAKQADMVALLSAVHRKLGSFRSGKTQGWNDNIDTAGHMITLSYSATYQNGTADEQFVYRLDGGQARLAGYHVNSDQLILR